MHVADFLLLLSRQHSKCRVGSKKTRVNALCKDILGLLGSVVDFDRSRSDMWDKIDHIDLGVQQGGGEGKTGVARCRRIPGGFKTQVCMMARNKKGKGAQTAFPNRAITDIR